MGYTHFPKNVFWNVQKFIKKIYTGTHLEVLCLQTMFCEKRHFIVVYVINTIFDALKYVFTKKNSSSFTHDTKVFLLQIIWLNKVRMYIQDFLWIFFKLFEIQFSLCWLYLQIWVKQNGRRFGKLILLSLFSNGRRFGKLIFTLSKHFILANIGSISQLVSRTAIRRFLSRK